MSSNGDSRQQRTDASLIATGRFRRYCAVNARSAASVRSASLNAAAAAAADALHCRSSSPVSAYLADRSAIDETPCAARCAGITSCPDGRRLISRDERCETTTRSAQTSPRTLVLPVYLRRPLHYVHRRQNGNLNPGGIIGMATAAMRSGFQSGDAIDSTKNAAQTTCHVGIVGDPDGTSCRPFIVTADAHRSDW